MLGEGVREGEVEGQQLSVPLARSQCRPVPCVSRVNIVACLSVRLSLRVMHLRLLAFSALSVSMPALVCTETGLAVYRQRSGTGYITVSSSAAPHPRHATQRVHCAIFDLLWVLGFFLVSFRCWLRCAGNQSKWKRSCNIDRRFLHSLWAPRGESFSFIQLRTMRI